MAQLDTELLDILDIEHPIIQGGMGFVQLPEFQTDLDISV